MIVTIIKTSEFQSGIVRLRMRDIPRARKSVSEAEKRLAAAKRRLARMESYSMSVQPYRGSEFVILERRKADGSLDFNGEQPPARPMKFDRVYDMYFRDTANSADRGTAASYEQLAAWLKQKGWTMRAAPWHR